MLPSCGTFGVMRLGKMCRRKGERSSANYSLRGRDLHIGPNSILPSPPKIIFIPSCTMQILLFAHCFCRYSRHKSFIFPFFLQFSLNLSSCLPFLSHFTLFLVPLSIFSPPNDNADMWAYFQYKHLCMSTSCSFYPKYFGNFVFLV